MGQQQGSNAEAAHSRTGARSKTAFDPVLRAKLMRVPRFSQSEFWDCGFACVSMLLPNHPSTSELLSRTKTKSVWTIDLAAICVKEEVMRNVTLYTTNAGVLDSYEEMGYYSAAFQQDKPRVEGLFRDAGDMGIEVNERSVTSAELANMLEEVDTFAIVLVDSSKLSRVNRGYQGHYILVLGFNPDVGSFVYYDPSPNQTKRPKVVKKELFDVARKADGTDEDILVLQMQPKTKL